MSNFSVWLRTWWFRLLLLAVVIVVGSYFLLEWRQGHWENEALAKALTPVIEKKDGEASMVAAAILGNYFETRANAATWSGVYWSFTFLAAILGALAGLILKLESFEQEKRRRDVAAFFSVTAALLITISTSGDFQRKWQSNRLAAAELEGAGYQLIEHRGEDARAYLEKVRRILLRRQLAVVGAGETNDAEGKKATADS
ncbi:MAG: hypothetical protein SF066_11040 [Thermoanaerobaculia bacterium]|nr:hypothetical protein [Thermoanaerobaculia bacterium]